MSAHAHGPLTWAAEPRCTTCGHRVARDGAAPRQTREYLRSPWTWPLAGFEVAGRAEARLRGWLQRSGRMPAWASGTCIQPCDPDCELGPGHCYWAHEPNHKPGWHSSEDCPERGGMASVSLHP